MGKKTSPKLNTRKGARSAEGNSSRKQRPTEENFILNRLHEQMQKHLMNTQNAAL